MFNQESTQAVDRIPIEILFELFQYLPRFKDVALCREVNRHWNVAGALIFNRMHPPIQFSNSVEMGHFNSLMESKIQIPPFIRFKFDPMTLYQHNITKFVQLMGSTICHYTLEPIYVLLPVRVAISGIITATVREGQLYTFGLPSVYGQTLLKLLAHAPHLTSLKITIDDPIILSNEELGLLTSVDLCHESNDLKPFQNLRVLDVTFPYCRYDHQEFSTLAILVQSPKLVQLKMSFECRRPNPWDAENLQGIVFQNVVKLLQKMKEIRNSTKMPKITVGVRISFHHNLGHEYPNSDTLREFGKLGVGVPFDSIELKYAQDPYDDNWNALLWTWLRNQSESLRKLRITKLLSVELPLTGFPKCESLQLTRMTSTMENLSTYFTNLRKFTIDYLAHDHLTSFVIKLPQLEEFRILKYLSEPWYAITGERQLPAVEEIISSGWSSKEVVNSLSPFKVLKNLKVLSLPVSNSNHPVVLGILYISKQGSLTKLNQLKFTTRFLHMKNNYEVQLASYHQRVQFLLEEENN